MASVLIVDDHQDFRLSLVATLKQAGHEVFEAKSGEEALRKLAERYYDLVITDLKLADVSGLDILKAAKEQDPTIEVILASGYGSIESAVEAMKMGAADFVTKPLNLDQLAFSVGRTLERKGLIAEVKQLRQRVRDKFSLGSIVGVSAKMKKVLELIPTVAASGSPVLIIGETGTGKELLAKALHRESPLKDKPFVTLNCAALPENLMESELFGHSRGAFTGALFAKKGMLVEADGGTIFLDEIGEMVPSIQVKILRFLEMGEIRPVGETRTMKVRARVLAATNRPLEEALKSKQFREDLYYRLNVLSIRLPPLRERKEDIPVLVNCFLKEFQKTTGRKGVTLTKEAMEALLNYPWPGNVRQLRNVIERALVLSRGRLISPGDFQLLEEKEVRAGVQLELLPLAEMEKHHLLSTLKACGGNQSKAARVLGISKITLWRKLKEYRVDPKSFARL